jgi:hypothetical protein
VLKRSGVNQIRPGNKKREVMTSHGFRKFFINQSEKANLNYTTLQLLSGHKLRRVDASYKRTSEEDMLAGYVKAIPRLTIDPTERLQQEAEHIMTMLEAVKPALEAKSQAAAFACKSVTERNKFFGLG